MMENRLQSSGNKSSGSAARLTNQESTSKSLAPSDRPSFTFIDHDDDLTSKRIKDANARKAIRSHVMRDVRRRERLAGLKRTSKREDQASSGKQPASKPREEPASASDERKLPWRNSPTPEKPEPERVLDVVKASSRQPPVPWMASGGLLSSRTPSPQSVPSSWFFDPFCTLPGASELPSMVDQLISYCTTVFIPMTFPVEHKAPGEVQMSLMVASSLSDPGSFFGLMSMSAAHRAILAGRHSDLVDSSEEERGNRVLFEPDYYIMKAKCIREMNAKVRDPSRSLSNEAFDTIINLLTGALIVGHFDEARIHLKGLKKMVELRGGITDDSLKNAAGIVSAILTCDVKAANGLMSKPIFPLTWDPQPLPPKARQRITPPASSTLDKLGTALATNDLVSSPLKKAVQGLRDMTLFDHLSRQDPQGLSQENRELLRVLTFETEYELASYCYRSPAHGGPEAGGENLHPIEGVARVASTCYISLFFIVSPPSTGMGRALTKHLKEALSRCMSMALSQLPRACHDLLAWALFIGAQGSTGQVEQPWFVQCLAHIAFMRGWRRWEELADVMTSYFYIPIFHDTLWQPIWDEAMALVVSSYAV